jgi:peptide/nickel transport system permease protein
LIATGWHFLITAPWVALLPGAFVVAVVFGLNHLARTLEEIKR